MPRHRDPGGGKKRALLLAIKAVWGTEFGLRIGRNEGAGEGLSTFSPLLPGIPPCICRSNHNLIPFNTAFMKTHAIHWKSKVTGTSGTGTKRFEKEAAEAPGQ